MRKLHILITAGPTREPIDPVRFISNYSTGLLGYEIAKEAKRRGHRVILISGPTALAKPAGVVSIDVLTARQMQQELKKRFSWCDCLIMSAAVSDFRAKYVAGKKIKRRRKKVLLELVPNPDILAFFGRKKDKQTVVGFTLETEDLKKNAQAKLSEKNLDLIIATQINANSYPFGQNKVKALIIARKGRIKRVNVTKARLARILLDSIEKTMVL